MKNYEKILKQLLDCWYEKKEINFLSIIEDLNDEEIDELLDVYKNMPDEMKDLIRKYQKTRRYFKNID